MAEEHQINWSGNIRAVLIQLWISPEPEHLVSRIMAALELSEATVKYALRSLEAHDYVASRAGGAPLPRFRHAFDSGGQGVLSNASLWSITEAGKAKASALAAEREGP